MAAETWHCPEPSCSYNCRPTHCEKCYGRGWYPECDEGYPETGDLRERYCDCPDGVKRRERES